MDNIFSNSRFLIVGAFAVGFLAVALVGIVVMVYTKEKTLGTIIAIVGGILGALLAIGAYNVFTNPTLLNPEANSLWDIFAGLWKTEWGVPNNEIVFLLGIDKFYRKVRAFFRRA